MASEEDHNVVYNEDDEDDDEPLNDVVLDDDGDDDGDPDDGDSPDSDDSDDADTNSTSSAAVVVPAVPPSSSAVPVAVLPPSSAPNNGSNRPRPPPPITHALAGASASNVAAPITAVVAMAAPNAVAATPVSERKPIDDSRRLFQRLWTDEDEIELLQGFLEYTTQRGPNWSGHHHDTTAFYDQIKSKLQLDCNKNQLVEKLRRLKKKYRNVVSRISSGKDFIFKSPHDQATFEISRKIWGNSIANRPEFDDDDQNPNPTSGTPFIGNLNSAPDHRTPTSFTIDVNSPNKMMMMMMNMATPPNTCSRKRSRAKVEEKSSRNVNPGVYEPVNLTPAGPAQSSVEETVKSYLSPLLKELVDNAAGVSGIGFAGVGGAKGIASLASNAIPMNFPGVKLGNGGEIMEERWRKQQILELEVYSKRLELVQDQIKLALGELRTRGK